MERIISPGTRIVEVISARRGGMAEKILRKIAHPAERENPTNHRQFGPWEDGVSKGRVCLKDRERTISAFYVILKLGVREGLFLEDESGMTVSLKPKRETELLLGVGSGLREERIRDVANQIVACYVIHGAQWADRKGMVFLAPYGSENRRERRTRSAEQSIGRRLAKSRREDVLLEILG